MAVKKVATMAQAEMVAATAMEEEVMALAEEVTAREAAAAMAEEVMARARKAEEATAREAEAAVAEMEAEMAVAWTLALTTQALALGQ